MNVPLLVDEKLVEEARQAGHHAMPEEAVRQALEEYVRRHKRLRIVELFGTIEYDEAYDYKAERMPADGAAGPTVVPSLRRRDAVDGRPCHRPQITRLSSRRSDWSTVDPQ